MERYRKYSDNSCEDKDEDCLINAKDGDPVGDELTLEDVLRLGGTKADFVMLARIDDSSELINGGKKGATDDLEEGELKDFISKLGLEAFADQQIIQDESEEETEFSKGTLEQKKTSQQDKSKHNLKTEAKKIKQPQDKKKLESRPSTSTFGHSVEKFKKKPSDVFEFFPRQTQLFKPGGKWYEMEYASETSSEPQNESLVSQYKTLAQKLYEREVAIFKSKKGAQNCPNSSWMKSVVSKGALADRMAATTLIIQDSTIHTLEHVESLVSLMKKKGGRRQSLMAVDTLKELLLSNLLPDSRKLQTFFQHPFDLLEQKSSGNRDARDRRLILWYFEHQLKLHVAEFVLALDHLAHDTVTTTKLRGLNVAFELLCNHPEQEKTLLVQVVNKLGDPEYKIASKASYLLEMVLHKHPSMKVVVCCEVERLMFRSNINAKAQYYAACFLNQVVLSHEDADLAAKLIIIYLTFFHAFVKKGIESKMLSALLTGVNRAYPYATTGDDAVLKQLDTLFKVVHNVHFNTAVQALMLLFQVMDSQQTISDRYYAALYRKLLDPALTTSSRQSMFLNLLYKSLKVDIVLRRIKAFIKRLLQVCGNQSPPFICGALFLVSEVMKAKPGLSVMLEKDEAEEEEKYQDLEEKSDDEDTEEMYVDADKSDENPAVNLNQNKLPSSWLHHQNLLGGKRREMYEPSNRNPLFCGAEHAGFWELQKLSHHFHPSVALFAKTLLEADYIQYAGDPLQDFTLIRFLDRFVFRNPKESKGKQNTDDVVMQPKFRRSFKTSLSLPVNSAEYLTKDESQIPVDEVFFYKYFKKRENEKGFKWKKGDDNESVEDVDDDEFEKMLDAYEGDSFFIDLKNDDLDFAGNVKPNSKKGGDANSVESDSDMDDGAGDDLDSEEISLGSMDEEDFEDELDGEGGEFLSKEECKKSGLHSAKRKKKTNVKKAVSASAEEFGCLLDENAKTKFEIRDMYAMANTDKADIKQLKWEVQRNDWISGRDDKTLRRKKAQFNKRKFGASRKLKMKKKK